MEDIREDDPFHSLAEYAWAKDESVYAYFPQTKLFYLAAVMKRASGKSVTVKYFDGVVRKCPNTQVYPLCLLKHLFRHHCEEQVKPETFLGEVVLLSDTRGNDNTTTHLIAVADTQFVISDDDEMVPHHRIALTRHVTPKLAYALERMHDKLGDMIIDEFTEYTSMKINEWEADTSDICVGPVDDYLRKTEHLLRGSELYLKLHGPPIGDYLCLDHVFYPQSPSSKPVQAHQRPSSVSPSTNTFLR